MSNDPSIFHFKPEHTIKDLLERNKAWAESTSALRPALFPCLARSQSPPILWIGCSDSRIPETSVLDVLPGEVFVHRNIANVLPYGDLSSLSVIQYAVEILKVKYVIVCGHTNCGGVKAALGNQKLGLIDNWIRHIRDVRARHQKELSLLPDGERLNRLVELNVIAQVHHLLRMPNVRAAIRDDGLQVQGLVYDIESGMARTVDVPDDPDEEAHSTKLE